MKTIQMPKALLDAWLADLRSGLSNQGQHRLHGSNGYCCLGRLQIAAGDPDVELSGEGVSLDVPSIDWLNEHGVKFYKNGELDGNPDVVVPEHILVKIRSSRYERSLAALNDEGVCFMDIADIIEANAEVIE